MRGGDGGEAVVVSFRFFWTDGLLARRAGIGGWWWGLSLFFLFGVFLIRVDLSLQLLFIRFLIKKNY
jgi:hypothetical protein